ncbi:MAG: tRNA(Ile)(2)-agmatinylcytidine synthase [Desulfurococcaceae archaeon]
MSHGEGEGLELHIGLDDFDSPSGGCTTHLASRIVGELARRGAEFLDYPNLVRLNPAVPWKTRGNGAVAIRVLVGGEGEAMDVLEMVEAIADEYAREFRNPKHQPAIAARLGEVSWELRHLGFLALHDVVPLDLAERLASKSGPGTIVRAPSGRRGIVGALAAVGNPLEGDHTFELTIYREPGNYGSPRRVDEESVGRAEAESGGALIMNYDPETGRALAVPRGPDPVMLGLRAEQPGPLLEALPKICADEGAESAVLYRTNQHTDAHVLEVGGVAEAHPYRCVGLAARVSREPRRIEGGHVIFSVADGTGTLDVAAYEPTKRFRDRVQALAIGDLVYLVGCVRPPSSRHPATLNLEKLRVLELAEKYVLENPRCPRCGARMESAGRGKGFRCPKCGYTSRELGKVRRAIPRELAPGWYEPPRHAFKHLMKPVARFGREKSWDFRRPWTPLFLEGGEVSRLMGRRAERCG